MLFSLRDAPADHLGVRSGEDRRTGIDRRSDSRPGRDRRASDRRGAGFRSVLLAAAVVALPSSVKPEVLAAWPRPLIPTVTTTIDTVVGVPAEHAYDDFIREASTRYRVDATLVRSVMQAESAFDALAVSRAGAMGLMQLMPTVAEELGVADPFDPKQNIFGGAKYLRRLLDLYQGNVPLALAGYNAGTTNVDEYGGVPPFPETQNYVKQVTQLVARSQPALKTP
jgi:soluble lytic murein transglycosylase-like protein